jgi:hypothetical protein
MKRAAGASQQFNDARRRKFLSFTSLGRSFERQ